MILDLVYYENDKKFDDLNETFNVSGEIVSSKVETIEEKIQKVTAPVDDIKKIIIILEEIYILL